MFTSKRMRNSRQVGVEIAIKRAACIVILFAPILGWPQADGNGAPMSESRSVESTKAPIAGQRQALREVSTPQVLDRLMLSASQQSLWDVYKGKVDAYTAAYYRQKPVLPSPEEAATHQVARMVDNLQNRLAALEDVEEAAKSLYASLTAVQQKTANEMLILTVPTFSPSNSESVRSVDERRKDNKFDGGRHSPRGGAGTAGPLLEN
jgi:hypothetical protein